MKWKYFQHCSLCEGSPPVTGRCLICCCLNKLLSKHSWVAGDLRYQDTSVTLQIIVAHVCSNQNVIGLKKLTCRNTPLSLHWRHNGHDCVSNHQPHDCLFKRLFWRRSKKTSKPRVSGLCAGNSPGTGEFPAQMTSYAENVSIWWRHQVVS